MNFKDAVARCGLIAILRGVEPEEVEAIGLALIEAGIEIIEVPLNSPRPFDSISRLVSAVGDRAIIGAGTVLDVNAVVQVARTGASLALAPNCNLDVIRAMKAAGLTAMPGVATASEAFSALDAGADSLKLFPARELGAGTITAWRAVLPRSVPIFAVGGVDETTFGAFLAAGAAGFGLGSSLYSPCADASEVGRRAKRAVAAWHASRSLS